jgi:hypothetical protein
VFTARYRLIAYIKRIAFRLLKVKLQTLENNPQESIRPEKTRSEVLVVGVFADVVMTVVCVCRFLWLNGSLYFE